MGIKNLLALSTGFMILVSSHSAGFAQPLAQTQSPSPHVFVKVSSKTRTTRWFKKWESRLVNRSQLHIVQNISQCPKVFAPKNDALILDFTADGLQCKALQVSGAPVQAVQANAESAYQVLQQLNYRFWHPFKVVIPPALDVTYLPLPNPAPFFHQRGFVPHTMHPIELTPVLNGWGLKGPDDELGWQALLPYWESYLEWLVAHRQTKIEWVLLEKGRWKTFSRGELRQKRLKTLVDMAHQWGLQVGVDAPVALQQQNGWRLLPLEAGQSLPEQLTTIEKSLDWLAVAGFDFVSTEMGSTEFSNGGAQRMLQWLNHATDYLDTRYQRQFFTKVHISSGQTTPVFKDPQTGKPLNFNFLPLYADPRLGVLPHTVQVYSLDDPAPTYGNQDFSEMLRFMQMITEANQRAKPQRSMYWYPETAYWVNYDNHVPLFLPVYAHRRLHDLHLMHDKGIHASGQMVFTSGWEWGYWLNDVLSANSAINPYIQETEAQAMNKLLNHELSVFGAVTPEIVQLLQDTMQTQYNTLILGKVKGKTPQERGLSIVKNNGMAYLSGQETWSQLGALVREWGLTGFQVQPDRWQFGDVAHKKEAAEAYRAEVYPLLSEMDASFASLAHRADALALKVPAHLQAYFSEIQSGLWVNVYRVRFTQSLFQAALGQFYKHEETRVRYLQDAAFHLERAESVVKKQRAHYRSPWATAWGVNPTAYKYGYFWPADTLFYWKRDLEQVKTRNFSPCLWTLIDPIEVAFPDPEQVFGAQLGRRFFQQIPIIKDCLQSFSPAMIY